MDHVHVYYQSLCLFQKQIQTGSDMPMYVCVCCVSSSHDADGMHMVHLLVHPNGHSFDNNQ
jgi:hypothetical protein